MMLSERAVLRFFPGKEETNTMNLFGLVGEIHKKPILKETSTGIKVADITLKVQRPFVSSDGTYEYDFIQVELWRGIAETLCNVADSGTWVSIKGRIASKPYEKEGNQYYFPTFIAESVKYIK